MTERDASALRTRRSRYGCCHLKPLGPIHVAVPPPSKTRMFVILRRCSRIPAFSRGYASGPPSDTALPPFNSDAWRKAFPWIFGGRRDRVSIGNPETARIVAKAVLNAAPPSNAGGKVVLEAFPGTLCTLILTPSHISHFTTPRTWRPVSCLARAPLFFFEETHHPRGR